MTIYRPLQSVGNQSDTQLKAVYSDTWKRSFDAQNDRSRRREYACSGVRTSGLTAVFCEDWKDDDGCEAILSAHDCTRTQCCHTLEWETGYGRKRKLDDFMEVLISPWYPSQRQFQEHSSSMNAATIFFIPSPEPLAYQYQPGVFDADCRFPLPKAVPMTEIKKGSQVTSTAKEVKNLSSIMPDPGNNVKNRDMSTSKTITEQDRTREDEVEIEDHGFDVWSRFIECSIRLDVGRGLDG
jgi:hypothetical protein